MAEAHISARLGKTVNPVNGPKSASRGELRSGLIFQLGDLCAILAIPITGSLLRQSTENLTRNLCFWPLLSVITVILIASHGGYRINRSKGIQGPIILAISCYLATSAAMLMVAVLLGHPHILARPWTAADLILTPALLGTTKTLLALRLLGNDEATARHGPCVVCFDHIPPGLPSGLSAQDMPPRAAGVLFLSKRLTRRPPPDWPELPDLAALVDMVRTKKIQDIVFVHHHELDNLTPLIREEILADLLACSARLWLAFDVTSTLPEMLKGKNNSCKLVPLMNESLVSSNNFTKRLFDIVVSCSLLVIAAPLILVTAAMVKASSPGPVIFRQTRTGAQGREFTVFKFRTMSFSQGERLEQARQGDLRVTEIGHFLRKNSLDEILQLFNVIRGDMSLVGPRPHAPATEVEGINFEQAVRLYRIRHRVKPGMTGLAQIRGQRGETRAIRALEQRLASDLEYIQTWSLWLDIVILIRTIPVVLRQTNAW